MISNINILIQIIRIILIMVNNGTKYWLSIIHHFMYIRIHHTKCTFLFRDILQKKKKENDYYKYYALYKQS